MYTLYHSRKDRFFLNAPEALPHWLKEAVEWKARAYEAEVKGAAEKERADTAEETLRKQTEETAHWICKYQADASRFQEQKKELAAAEERERRLKEVRHIDEWHEDYGDVLWWTFPIEEPPYCGSPLDSDWPDYHTHWTPIVVPEKEGEAK